VALRIIMFGTGDFAVPTFRALYDSPHEVVALYTQPDRPTVGRHKPHQPMKDLAIERGTPVFQPEKINTPESLEELQALQGDLFLVAAYGQILSRKFLAIPPRGTINVHASLLPKYRGAAPINYAILHGEREAGVTIIDVIPQLDAGPMLGKVALPILPGETAGELEVRLAEAGAKLTLEVIDQIEKGTVLREPQDESQVVFAPKMTKDMGLIDWNKSASEIEWHVRGMQPWPNPVSFLHQPGKPGRRFVIRKVEIQDRKQTSPPGSVIEVNRDSLVVQAGLGAISILEIQPEGKRTMSVAEFLRGAQIVSGDLFSSSGDPL